MEIWRGRVLWRGYAHLHPIPIPNRKNRRFPIPNRKNRRFPIPIPIPSQRGDSPSKRTWVRTIPMRMNLFVISNQQ